MEKQRHSKVLVVDDIESTRILLQKSLSEAGYEVATATNGEHALTIMSENAPDYVITDWRMPGINGQELCQRIRERGLRQYTYVIMMTAHGDAQKASEMCN